MSKPGNAAVLADRIWKRTKRNAGCWIWQGKGLNDRGYGHIKSEGKEYLVHRVVFAAIHGWWPDFVCHSCDRPGCVNPGHLFAGNNSVNQLDSVAKGRHHHTRKHFCKNGHPFDESNTYIRDKRRRWRACRKCHAETERERQRVLRAA